MTFHGYFIPPDSDSSGVVEGQVIIASRTGCWTQLQLAVRSIIFRLVLKIVYLDRAPQFAH